MLRRISVTCFNFINNNIDNNLSNWILIILDIIR